MLKDLFTEKDGVSFCPVRAGYIVGFLIIIGLTINDVFNSKDYHFVDHASDWMKALAEYIGLGGAAVAGKNATEKE